MVSIVGVTVTVGGDGDKIGVWGADWVFWGPGGVGCGVRVDWGASGVWGIWGALGSGFSCFVVERTSPPVGMGDKVVRTGRREDQDCSALW